MAAATPAPARLPLTRTQRVLLWCSFGAYLVGGAVLYAVLDHDVLARAAALPMALVGALLALSVVNYMVRAWRWVVLGHAMQVNVPARASIVYYIAGYSLTSTPGKAGEAVRLWFMKSGHGVPYVRSLPMMLADRLIDMWAVMLLCLVSFAAFASYAWHGLLLGAVIGAVSLPLLFPRRLEPVLRWALGLAPSRARLLVRARRLLRAMGALARWRIYGVTLLPTMVGWFAECAALYLLLQHLGAPISLLNAVFVFSFSVIVGAVSMLPGGLGSTEATVVILLRALGVDFDVALAATAIIRLTTFWFAVVLGGLLLPAAIGASARWSRRHAAAA